MFGRYGSTAGERELLIRFDLTKIAEQIPLSFNVAPGMIMPVLVSHSSNSLATHRPFRPPLPRPPSAARVPRPWAQRQ